VVAHAVQRVKLVGKMVVSHVQHHYVTEDVVGQALFVLIMYVVHP